MALTSTHIVTVFVLSVLWEVVIHRRLFYECCSILLLLRIMILVTVAVTVPIIVFSYVVHFIFFVEALASSSAGAD
jgi:hypothetical protein